MTFLLLLLYIRNGTHHTAEKKKGMVENDYNYKATKLLFSFLESWVWLNNINAGACWTVYKEGSLLSETNAGRTVESTSHKNSQLSRWGEMRRMSREIQHNMHKII